MTKADIMKLAQKAGLPDPMVFYAGYERFAKLVVANIDPKSFMSWQEGYEVGVVTEREACAKVCEAQGEYGDEQYAKAIRARTTT